MDLNEVLAEIRELRSDIKELKKEFYLFKGKSVGVVGFLTIIATIVFDFIKKKL